MIINKASFLKCVVGTGVGIIAVYIAVGFIFAGYQWYHLTIAYLAWTLLFVTIFPRVIATYKSKLLIDDRGLSMFIGEENMITILWDEVCEVKYIGNNYLPINDRMYVIARHGSIIIDYNRRNYLSIWKLIINEITKRRSTIKLDDRLLKRITAIDTVV